MQHAALGNKGRIDSEGNEDLAQRTAYSGKASSVAV